ncbi:2Fe-2S iron-sulfur cluster binding domain protein [delta proteobacterium NaphS2]|nr:2Fe-2S iron-sulfur cluster binding domain protein [delta proteobacterium NaphS2]
MKANAPTEIPEKARVTFQPSGKETRVLEHTLISDAALDAGLRIESVCGGKGTCGKCCARIVQGEVSEATSAEEKFFTPEELNQGMCLLCQRRILGDAVVSIDRDFEATRDYAPDKGALPEASLELDSHVAKTYLELDPPTIKDQQPDLERVLNFLPDQVAPDPEILSALPHRLRKSDYLVTSVVINGRLMAIEKGNTLKQCYGIAVDVGTTTVAAYLVDLGTSEILASGSLGNRQDRYGADVISRISHTQNGPEKLGHMKELVVQTIDEIVGNLLEISGVDSRNIYIVSIVGNTVMSHFLMGVSAEHIASAPFVPVFSRLPILTVESLGLKSLTPQTRFFLLPNIAGYVGADTAGMILSTKIYEGSGTRLAIDIGTNGEMVLALKGRLLTCSTAAGPAFEGGSISQGMRAEPGAIYAVRLDGDVLLKSVDNQPPKGVCGSGFVDVISEMVRLGIINRMGRIVAPSDCPDGVPPLVKRRITQNGTGNRFVLSNKDHGVILTQKDVSELQLAKGAIRAGIEILMEEVGLSAGDLDQVLLAGAFGSGLRAGSLKGIGLLPNVPLDRISSVGNAAGKGAVMALLSRKQKALAEKVTKVCEHVELSTHKRFSEKFARALLFD